MTAEPSVAERYRSDLDRSIAGIIGELAALVADVGSCRYRPTLWSRGVTEFQLTRGRLGVSMQGPDRRRSGKTGRWIHTLRSGYSGVIGREALALFRSL